MKTTRTLAALTVLLLLAACGSSGIGDVLGGGSQQSSTYNLSGTVDSVDVNSRSIYLTNVSGYNSMLSSGGNGSSVRVYYDQNTRVDYNGRSYRPEDLERGDQVSVRADQSGNSLVAEAMTVTYDAGGSVNSNNGSYPGTYPGNNGSYGSTLRGTIQYVDTSRRTMTIDRGNGTSVVEYDTSLPVYYGSQTYRISDLERGDEVELHVRDLGNGRLLAQDVTVTRSISSNNNGTYGSGSTATSTYRGTVQSIDTSRRTIQLSSTTWVAGFNRGTSGGTTMTLQYDTNSSVEVNGQAYPITNLERGDVVDVQLQNVNSSLPFAQRITLVRDVNSR